LTESKRRFCTSAALTRGRDETQRDKLREDIALLEMELADARIDQFDVEGILAFATHILTNAAHLWMELDLNPKQQLQQALFPQGLAFDGEKFGTVVTCSAFKRLTDDASRNSGLASPDGLALVGPRMSRSISGLFLAA